MPERSGHRGYIGARPLNGSRTPQHVQNIVIRDYAKRKNCNTCSAPWSTPCPAAT